MAVMEHQLQQTNMATDNALQQPEALTIVVVGASGSGKSATGNTILRKRAFTIRQTQNPETLSCQAETGEFEGTPISVVDTPWSNTNKCISYCAPGPHAFLVVIPLNKVTDVERNVKALQIKFGEDASRYTIVLFTHGDELLDGVTADQIINQNPLADGVEYHVFNNRDEDPSQVRELLEKINTMVQRNGGSYCIKAKDWKQQYLYPLVSAVAIGGGFGAASGGTGSGACHAFLGHLLGLGAAQHGGTRAVGEIIAAWGALIAVATVAGSIVFAVAGNIFVVARVITAAGAGAGYVAVVVAGVRVGTIVWFAIFIGCYAIGIASAGAGAASVGAMIKAGVVFGAGIALKASAAVAAGAGIPIEMVEELDDDIETPNFLELFGGAAIGVSVAVAYDDAGVATDDDDVSWAYFTALCGVLMFFLVSFRIVRAAASTINKIIAFAFATVVYAGAAFGAAAGVLGESGFVEGAMIYSACRTVTWWLNRKD